MNITYPNDITARKIDPSFSPVDPSSADLSSSSQNQVGEKRDFHAELMQEHRPTHPLAIVSQASHKDADTADAPTTPNRDRSSRSKNIPARTEETSRSMPHGAIPETATIAKERLPNVARNQTGSPLGIQKMRQISQQNDGPRTILAQKPGDDITTGRSSSLDPINPLNNRISGAVLPTASVFHPESPASDMAIAVNTTPSLSFLSGRLDEIDPSAIPLIVSGNRFIKAALAAVDINQFMNTPVPTAELAKDLGLNPDGINQLVGTDKIPDYLTPGEFFKLLHLDRNRIGAELKLLRANVQFDGLSSYMKKAALMSSDDTGNMPTLAKEQDQNLQHDKKTNKLDETTLDRISGLVQLPANSMPLQPSPIAPMIPMGTPDETRDKMLVSDPLHELTVSDRQMVSPLQVRSLLHENEIFNTPMIIPSSNFIRDESQAGAIQAELPPIATLTLIKPLLQNVDFQNVPEKGMHDSSIPRYMEKGDFGSQVDPFYQLGALMDPLLTQTIKAGSLDLPLHNPNEGLSSVAPSIPSPLMEPRHNAAEGVNPSLAFSPLVTNPTAESLVPNTSELRNDITAPLPNLTHIQNESYPNVNRLPPEYQRAIADSPKILFHELKSDEPAFVPAPVAKEVSPPVLAAHDLLGFDRYNLPMDGPHLTAAFLQSLKDSRLNEASPKIMAPLASLPTVGTEEPTSHSFLGSQGNGQKGASSNGRESGNPLVMMSPIIAGEPKSNGVSFFHANHESKETGNLDPAARAQIVQNIMDSSNTMMKRGGGSMRIDLSSKELGSLDVAVKVVGNKLDLNILAHSPQTRDLIIAEIPRLRESLQHQNLGLNDVNVSVGNGNSYAQSFSDGSERQRNYFQDYQERISDGGRSQTMVTQSTQTISPRQWDHYQGRPHNGRIQVLA